MGVPYKGALIIYRKRERIREKQHKRKPWPRKFLRNVIIEKNPINNKQRIKLKIKTCFT